MKNTNHTPRLSVVTINRNNAEGLRRTIASVAAQSSFEDIEYVVIDGNSTDSSRDVMAEFSDHIHHAVSEPDTGIYNAMNKGLAKASGTYVMHLNSGDAFYNADVVRDMLAQAGDEEVLYGHILTLEDGKETIIPSAASVHFYQRYQHNLPPQPALWVKRELLKRIGGFDERYRIIADVVMIARLFSKQELHYKFIDLPVTIFDMNGISSGSCNQSRIYEERKRFITEEFPAYLPAFEAMYHPSLFRKIVSRFRLR